MAIDTTTAIPGPPNSAEAAPTADDETTSEAVGLKARKH